MQPADALESKLTGHAPKRVSSPVLRIPRDSHSVSDLSGAHSQILAADIAHRETETKTQGRKKGTNNERETLAI